jgi:hypothetical protein
VSTEQESTSQNQPSNSLNKLIREESFIPMRRSVSSSDIMPFIRGNLSENRRKMLAQIWQQKMKKKREANENNP